MAYWSFKTINLKGAVSSGQAIHLNLNSVTASLMNRDSFITGGLSNLDLMWLWIIFTHTASRLKTCFDSLLVRELKKKKNPTVVQLQMNWCLK